MKTQLCYVSLKQWEFTEQNGFGLDGSFDASTFLEKGYYEKASQPQNFSLSETAQD